MINPAVKKELSALAEYLKNAGAENVSFCITRTASEITALRGLKLERSGASEDSSYIVNAEFSKILVSAEFTSVPEKENALSSLKGQAELKRLLAGSEEGSSSACKSEKVSAKVPLDNSAKASPDSDCTVSERESAEASLSESSSLKKSPFIKEGSEALLPGLLKAARAAYDIHETSLLENLSYEQNEESIYMLDEKGEETLADSTGYKCLKTSVIAKGNGSSEYAGHCIYLKKFSEKAAEALVRETAREACEGLSGKPVLSGAYPVILKNSVMAELMEAYLPAFYAENQKQGQSCLSGKLGMKAVSEYLSLREIPDDPRGRVARRIDDEGTPVSEKYILRDGIFETALSGLSASEKDGRASTGNGFRPAPGENVSTGVTNVILEAKVTGEGTMEALMNKLDNGLLVTAIDGTFAGTDIKTGDFSLIARGRIIKGGRAKGAFREVTIAGNLFKALTSVKEAGTDYAATFPDLACVLAPSVLIESLVVSGV